MLFYVRVTMGVLLLRVATATRVAQPGGRPAGPPGGGFGLGTGPIRDDVPRIRLYERTPGVVDGRETEIDPTEPTLDIDLPEASTATGAGVLGGSAGGHLAPLAPGASQSLTAGGRR